MIPGVEDDRKARLFQWRRLVALAAAGQKKAGRLTRLAYFSYASRAKRLPRHCFQPAAIAVAAISNSRKSHFMRPRRFVFSSLQQVIVPYLLSLDISNQLVDWHRWQRLQLHRAA